MTSVSASAMFGWGPLRIERRRLKIIMALALPIIGGMGSQNILNLVDTFMVSRLGKEAVGAVGMGSYLNFLSMAFITGLSAGVQAMASRRKGEGLTSETAIPLNGGLLMVLCMAVPLSIVLILLAPSIFPLLVDDPRVVAIGTSYYQVRLLGMVAVGANFAFRGYWNGVSMSRLYLRTLLVMHASNVVISYVLIFGKLGLPAMGATGAGLGTTISTYIGTAYYIYLGHRHARGAGFLRAVPGMDTIKSMLRLSIPSGAQQLLFAGGFTVLFSIVAEVGTNELAAANVLANITLVAILPGLGLGLGAASLVGQALGRKDRDDAMAWGWDVSRVAVMVVAAIAVPMALVPGEILAVFFADEPEALAVAIAPLRLVGITVAFDSIGTVLLNALIGAGATRMALTVSVSAQWFLFLPAAYLVGPVFGFGLLGIWVAQIVYRSLMTLVLMSLWRSRRWSDIQV